MLATWHLALGWSVVVWTVLATNGLQVAGGRSTGDARVYRTSLRMLPGAFACAMLGRLCRMLVNPHQV